jgi:hypothetical protein
MKCSSLPWCLTLAALALPSASHGHGRSRRRGPRERHTLFRLLLHQFGVMSGKLTKGRQPPTEQDGTEKRNGKTDVKAQMWQLPLTILVLVALSQNAPAFYNPSAGRWLSRDPIEERGGLNLYSFVGNMPLDHADAVGLQTFGGVPYPPCPLGWKEDPNCRPSTPGYQYGGWVGKCPCIPATPPTPPATPTPTLPPPLKPMPPTPEPPINAGSRSYDQYTSENGVECHSTCYCTPTVMRYETYSADKSGFTLFVLTGATFSSEGCMCNYTGIYGQYAGTVSSFAGGFGKMCSKCPPPR